MKLDNKKKGLLLMVCAGVPGLILFFAFLYSGEGKEDEAPVREVNILADLPDPDVEELPGSKLEAYGRDRSSIDDYWDSIRDGEPQESGDEGTERAGARRSGRNGRDRSSVVEPVSYEDLFGSPAGGSTDSRADILRRRAQRDSAANALFAQMHQEQLEVLREMAGNGAAAPGGAEETAGAESPEREERERIDINSTVRVVRSGGISTIDDGFSSVSENGFSSLDGESREFEADEAYPFKCMFVRQEKLKSSQRVSLRLLEDIVVEGQLVRKNTHLNAVCTINDRVDLKVTTIDIGGRIINLDFEAYDNDGVKGLYAPDLNVDTSLEDALKQVGVNAGKRSLSSQVGQTVSDLVSAGSVVVTGKGKDKTVTIPAGYHFYLVRKKKNR